MTAALLGAAVAAGLTLAALVVASRLQASGEEPSPVAPDTGAGPSSGDRVERASVLSAEGSDPGPTNAADADPLGSLASKRGLTEVEPGRYEGEVDGLPVIVRQVRPPLPFDPRSSVKTEITTSFTVAPPLPFLVHERGPAVVGAAVTTGDARFDTRLVVRSGGGEAVAALFGPLARAAILRYADEAPSVDLTDHRIDVVVEGAADETGHIDRLITLQVEVVTALTTID